MKDFRRIFRYAEKLKLIVSGYIIFTTISVVFSAFNLALLIPFLNIIFDQVEVADVVTMPENKLTIEYGIYLFRSIFVDIISEDGKMAAVVFVCYCIVVSVFLTNVFRYLAAILSAKLKADTLKNMRMDIFQKVSFLDLSYFTEKKKGDLIARITNDVQEINSTILNSLKTLVQEPLKIIVYFIWLFVLSYKLTLFTLLIVPVMAFLMAELIKRLKKQAVQSQGSIGKIVNIFEEMLSGMRVVKAFNGEGKMQEKMREETSFYRRLSISMSLKREMASPISEFLGVSLVIIILYYGTSLILGGESEMQPAALISYLAFLSQIISPGKAFSNGLTNMTRGLASAERVFQVIDQESKVQNKPDCIEFTGFQNSIEFKNVNFAYQYDAVLQDVNLTIKKGQMIALVGSSGAGKSTMADLLPRFYDVTSGEILIDGVNISDIKISSLRKHMGIVTQESILFNDTVFGNIAFGKEKCSMEEVVEAAKVANAHDFIMELEHGYHTFIGERGGRLSGGQRQRLSIARAVLKDPEILILDEATSALDSESEKLVQDALSKLMHHRTSVVIAHRLSTIQHANEIIVMDKGKVVERGNHDQLLKLGGVYKKLSSMQNIFIDAEN